MCFKNSSSKTKENNRFKFLQNAKKNILTPTENLLQRCSRAPVRRCTRRWWRRRRTRQGATGTSCSRRTRTSRRWTSPRGCLPASAPAGPPASSFQTTGARVRVSETASATSRQYPLKAPSWKMGPENHQLAPDVASRLLAGIGAGTIARVFALRRWVSCLESRRPFCTPAGPGRCVAPAGWRQRRLGRPHLLR